MNRDPAVDNVTRIDLVRTSDRERSMAPAIEVPTMRYWHRVATVRNSDPALGPAASTSIAYLLKAASTRRDRGPPP
jgi:hypothetical protein